MASNLTMRMLESPLEKRDFTLPRNREAGRAMMNDPGTNYASRTLKTQKLTSGEVPIISARYSAHSSMHTTHLFITTRMQSAYSNLLSLQTPTTSNLDGEFNRNSN